MEWLFWVAGALLLVVIETMTADLTLSLDHKSRRQRDLV